MCQPGELAHLQQDDIESFSGEGGSGVATARPPADDKDLCLLQVVSKKR